MIKRILLKKKEIKVLSTKKAILVIAVTVTSLGILAGCGKKTTVSQENTTDISTETKEIQKVQQDTTLLDEESTSDEKETSDVNEQGTDDADGSKEASEEDRIVADNAQVDNEKDNKEDNDVDNNENRNENTNELSASSIENNVEQVADSGDDVVAEDNENGVDNNENGVDNTAAGASDDSSASGNKGIQSKVGGDTQDLNKDKQDTGTCPYTFFQVTTRPYSNGTDTYNVIGFYCKYSDVLGGDGFNAARNEVFKQLGCADDPWNKVKGWSSYVGTFDDVGVVEFMYYALI